MCVWVIRMRAWLLYYTHIGTRLLWSVDIVVCIMAAADTPRNRTRLMGVDLPETGRDTKRKRSRGQGSPSGCTTHVLLTHKYARTRAEFCVLPGGERSGTDDNYYHGILCPVDACAPQHPRCETDI